MRKQCDQREQPQERRCGSPYRQLRPLLPLRLESEMPPHLLIGRLQSCQRMTNQERIFSGSAPRSVQRRAWVLNPPRGSRINTQRLFVPSAPLGGVTLQTEPGHSRRARPKLEKLKGCLHQQPHAHPTQPAALHEVLVSGTDRVSVDALVAAIFSPQRFSKVSSMPRMRGPSGTNASTSNPNQTLLASRINHIAWLRAR